MNIEICPLQYVGFDGVRVYFGMKREVVNDALGIGDFIGGRYYYFDGELAVDYDSEGKLEFVEFLGGADGILKPHIHGISVFESDAESVVSKLAQINGCDYVDVDGGFFYKFENVSIGLYRELRPCDVAEMVAEVASDGRNLIDLPELEEDMKRANHWATVGAGTDGYYAR